MLSGVFPGSVLTRVTTGKQAYLFVFSHSSSLNACVLFFLPMTNQSLIVSATSGKRMVRVPDSRLSSQDVTVLLSIFIATCA